MFKIIKTIVASIIVLLTLVAGMTFMAEDLSSVIVYKNAYPRYDYTGTVLLGIECKDQGNKCKIEVIGKVPHLRVVSL